MTLIEEKFLLLLPPLDGVAGRVGEDDESIAEVAAVVVVPVVGPAVPTVAFGKIPLVVPIDGEVTVLVKLPTKLLVTAGPLGVVKLSVILATAQNCWANIIVSDVDSN